MSKQDMAVLKEIGMEELRMVNGGNKAQIIRNVVVWTAARVVETFTIKPAYAPGRKD